ncbi:hypothetical protein ES706_01808 [subsurface metagenome]
MLLVMKVLRVLVKILGFIDVASGLLIMFLVMKEKAFASKVVRIDKKGGQKVISTGPYATENKLKLFVYKS